MANASVKAQLLQKCLQLINANLTEIKHAMEVAQEAANEETKSSVGDKFETGRAMMQLEQEKLMGQLNEALQMKQALEQIDPTKLHLQIGHGTLVKAETGNYFLTVGLGKVMLENEAFFVISPASPIGQLIAGKKAGDTFSFRDKSTKILSVE